MFFKEVINCKKKGDEQLNLENYYQAWKFYTDALRLLVELYDVNEEYGLRVDTKTNIGDSRQESKILSKRSLALLKLKQYYYAYEDAKQITDFSPGWFKGYLRKANVEQECGLFEHSLKNYHLALSYLSLEQREDRKKRYESMINRSINHLLYMMQRERLFDYQITWIGTAIGLVAGMAFVSWDFVINRNNSYIHHPLLKLFIIGLISFLFYYLTSLQRYFSRKNKERLLQPPTSKCVETENLAKEKVE